MRRFERVRRGLGALFRQLRGVRHGPRDVLKAIVVLIVGLPVVGGGAALATFYVVPLPTVVPDPKPGALAQTTYIYAADESLIAVFHAEHNRELIDLETDMPEHLWKAVVAAEDARFFQHSGLDLRAIFRAAWADLRARKAVQGGSTITQQYVKNAYIEQPKRSIFRKLREALYASQLERSLSKQKILENYLNTVYLGSGAYGVQAAAKTYFNKPAKDLTLSEAALIVGVIPAPASLSPYENPEVAEARRIFVIDRMERLGQIDAATAEAARQEKPALAPPRQEVFRFPWFVDAVRRDLIERYKDLGPEFVYTGGLRVHTTLDPKMQEAAEGIVAKALNRADDPEAALAAVEPSTGYVKALVGGRDFNQDKYNIAIQGRRQPGSAFKPFVLVSALEQGIAPSARYSAPGKYCKIKDYRSEDGCINNFGNRGYGSLTLEQATVQSVNTVYIQVAQRVGAAKIVEVARRMGISSRSLAPDEKNLAIALGGMTYGVTPLEMASAYATLSAGGVYREPRLYRKVEQVLPNGSVRVLMSGPAEPVQALDPAVASHATRILSKVITSGTGKRADINRPAAGKTGTAQDFRNAWFVGYTPELSTAVWMGYRKATIPMRLVHGVRNVTGGTIPAQIWASFMKEALEDVAPGEFAKPGELPSDNRLRLPYRPPPSPSPSPSPEPEPSPEPSPSPSPTGVPSPFPSITPIGNEDD